MLEVQLDGGRSHFEPGETLSGTLQWLLDDPPDAVELRLVWLTRGRGDQDVGISRTLRIEAPAATGSDRFELELPSGPFSCSGRLLSIAWALELVALPGDRAARVDLVLAPEGREVTLGDVA